jgi:hypothetical protein
MLRQHARFAVLLILFVCACSAATISAQSTCNSPGKERWAIKTSLADGADISHSKKVGLNDLLALAQPAGVTNNDPRYNDARIPASSNSLNVKEGDIIRTIGWIYVVATETDCDYHIQISSQPRTLATNPPTATDDCMIVEVPRPDFISDTTLSTAATNVRNYVKTKLTKGNEPSSTSHGSVMIHAVCAQVTGQLFNDDAHLKHDGTAELRGKGGMHSKTLWELHAIVGFTIVPASQCTF